MRVSLRPYIENLIEDFSTEKKHKIEMEDGPPDLESDQRSVVRDHHYETWLEILVQ